MKFDLSEDKVLSSELVHNFPKEMIGQVSNVLKKLDNYTIKGLYGIKVTENIYKLAFELEEKYKLLFSYNNKNILLNLVTKKDELLVSIKQIDSDEKIELINSTISDKIFKDNLINTTNKK